MSEDAAAKRREIRARQQEGFAAVQRSYAAEMAAIGETAAAADALRDALGHELRASWIRRGMA